MSTVTPPSPTPPPSTAATPAPVDGETVPAEAVRLPPTLASTGRDLTLRGEVQAVNEDGSVRIATPRGPIDVKLPEPVPPRGTQVEVALPAGTPPRNITVTLPAVPAQPTPALPLPTPGLPAPPPVIISTPSSAGTLPPVSTTPGGQTPSPQATPAQAPATQAPVPHSVGIPLLQGEAPPAQGLSPQGLLDFLKTSLQAKTQPLLNGEIAQRPLQLGQMARLTPLQAPLLQPSALLPAGTPTAPALQQPLHLGGQPRPGLLTAPAATGTATPVLQQALTKAVIGPGIDLAAPKGQLAQPPQSSPLLRALQALLPQTATAPAAAPFAGAAPIQVQVKPHPLAHTVALPTPVSGQGAITAPAINNHAPIMPAALDVRVGAVLPTIQATALQMPGMASLLHGTPSMPVLFASVAGQTAQGLPVLDLPSLGAAPDLGIGAMPGSARPQPATMVLQFPAAGLSPAAIVRLDVLTATPGTVAATLPPMENAVTWDGLADALKPAPGQSAATQAALQAAIPRPGAAAFAAPVIMLASAMRQGDIAAWLGEKTLDGIGRTRGKADALARLAGDFATAARRMLADDAKPTGEWRAIQLPMLGGEELSRIQLHYRSFERDHDEQGQPVRQSGTRFVMDLALTRMGSMQVDGFSIGKKLDVTLRTEQALSPAMREQMRARYANAVGGIGFAGELNFASAANHQGWVVAEELPQVQQRT